MLHANIHITTHSLTSTPLQPPHLLWLLLLLLLLLGLLLLPLACYHQCPS
jgi:hypothetical protein